MHFYASRFSLSLPWLFFFVCLFVCLFVFPPNQSTVTSLPTCHSFCLQKLTKPALLFLWPQPCLGFPAKSAFFVSSAFFLCPLSALPSASICFNQSPSPPPSSSFSHNTHARWHHTRNKPVAHRGATEHKRRPRRKRRLHCVLAAASTRIGQRRHCRLCHQRDPVWHQPHAVAVRQPDGRVV